MDWGNSLLCCGIPDSMVSLNEFIMVSLDVTTLTVSQVIDCTFPEDASACATTASSVEDGGSCRLMLSRKLIGRYGMLDSHSISWQALDAEVMQSS